MKVDVYECKACCGYHKDVYLNKLKNKVIIGNTIVDKCFTCPSSEMLVYVIDYK